MTRIFPLHPSPVTGNVQPVRCWCRYPLRDRVESLGVRPAGSRKGSDNQRVFCSLSAVVASTAGLPPARDISGSGSVKAALRIGSGSHLQSDVDDGSTQRTGGQRTNVRRVDIGRRKPDGPSPLDGTAEATGEGQPDFPCGQRRKTSAPQSGGCGFLSFFPFRRLEQSPHFLGGAVLCLSFPFFVLISFPLLRMTTWQTIQETAKRIGFQNYQEYLESNHWLELRALKGVRFCESCGSRVNLVCHHIRYRNLLDVGPADLAVLCKDCHDDFHMACRRGKMPYENIEASQIGVIVGTFRTTDWYARWMARRQRKAVTRLAKTTKPHKLSYKKRFGRFLKNPTRQEAEQFCKWLLSVVPTNQPF